MARWLALILLLTVVAFAAACGDDDDDDDDGGNGTPAATEEETEEATEPAAGGASEVSIVDFAFDPADLEVSVGDTVTWTNGDAAPHTATADDDSFDTGNLNEGDSGEVTFEEAGEFAYHCEIHPDMVATVTVTE
jgi:plastocyanin